MIHRWHLGATHPSLISAAAATVPLYASTGPAERHSAKMSRRRFGMSAAPAGGPNDPQPRNPKPREDDDVFEGEVEGEEEDVGADEIAAEVGGAEADEFDFARDPARPVGYRRPVPQASGDGLKAIAIPILATVGVLLLVPGVWAILLLSGAQVWSSHRSSARPMALAMLVCWPIALALFGAAMMFFKQIQREKARRAAK